MKQLLTAIILSFCLPAIHFSTANAQFKAGADVVILGNTEVSIESLNLKPSATTDLSNKEITVSHTAVPSSTPGSLGSIQRVITINTPLSFIGSIGLNYLPAELNGNTPGLLNLQYHNGDFAYKFSGIVTNDNTGNKVMASTGVFQVNFAGITAVDIGAALPLNLLSFAAETSNNNTDIGWSTAQEINVSHFEIEKSGDGIHFSVIGEVDATGNNSTNQQYYQFIDNNPQSGISYYRLKMVDKDGKYTYSKVVVIRNGFVTGTHIFPNPVKNNLTVEFTSVKAQTADYYLYTIDGRLVLKAVFNIQKGHNLFTLNLSGLAAGTYILKIANEINSTVIKQ